jgi:hypothetical protein
MDETLDFLWQMANATGVGNNVSIHRSNVEAFHFFNGSVPLFTSPTYFVNNIAIHNNGALLTNNEVLFLPQPAWSCMDTGERRSGAVNGGMMGGFGFVIPQLAGSQSDANMANWNAHAHRAMLLMDWWTRGEGAAQWSNWVGSLPAAHIWHTDDVLSNDIVKNAANFVQYYRPRPNAVGFQSFQTDSINIRVGSFINSPQPNTQANRNDVVAVLSAGVRNMTSV